MKTLLENKNKELASGKESEANQSFYRTSDTLSRSQTLKPKATRLHYQNYIPIITQLDTNNAYINRLNKFHSSKKKNLIKNRGKFVRLSNDMIAKDGKVRDRTKSLIKRAIKTFFARKSSTSQNDKKYISMKRYPDLKVERSSNAQSTINIHNPEYIKNQGTLDSHLLNPELLSEELITNHHTKSNEMSDSTQKWNLQTIDFTHRKRSMNLEIKTPFEINPDVLDAYSISENNAHTFSSEGELKSFFSEVVMRCISENIEVVRELASMSLSPYQERHHMHEKYKNFLASFGFKIIDEFVRQDLVNELQKITIFKSNYSLDFLCNSYFSLCNIKGSIIISCLEVCLNKINEEFNRWNTNEEKSDKSSSRSPVANVDFEKDDLKIRIDKLQDLKDKFKESEILKGKLKVSKNESETRMTRSNYKNREALSKRSCILLSHRNRSKKKKKIIINNKSKGTENCSNCVKRKDSNLSKSKSSCMFGSTLKPDKSSVPKRISFKPSNDRMSLKRIENQAYLEYKKEYSKFDFYKTSMISSLKSNTQSNNAQTQPNKSDLLNDKKIKEENNFRRKIAIDNIVKSCCDMVKKSEEKINIQNEIKHK